MADLPMKLVDGKYVPLTDAERNPPKITMSPAALQRILVDHANDKQTKLSTGGFTWTIDGTDYTFDMSLEGRSALADQYIVFGGANAPASIDWQIDKTTFVTIDAATFVAMALACKTFYTGTFSVLKTVVAAIQAGTITTTAQIDAAAWPANHG